ncbi:MAG TPA: hypothetical protein V6C86_24500 [Oculatellaceae cyanobacterium]
MRRTDKLLLVIPLSLAAVMTNVFVSPVTEAANPHTKDAKFATETPKLDGEQSKRPLQGSAQVLSEDTEGFATGATNKPLLQGNLVRSLPLSWNGVWQGGVRLDRLVAGARNNQLYGGDVELTLNLESAREAKPVIDLEVRELASSTQSVKPLLPSQAPPGVGPIRPDDPDIHYWHEGNVSHLDITNGAKMAVNGGTIVVGGKPGETAVLTISGRGSSLDGSISSSSSGGLSTGSGGTDYNGGAISTSGQTEYRGRYFKSDERIAMDGANIKANRVDIGNTTTMPGGSFLNATGNGNIGFLLRELNGSAGYLSPSQIASLAAVPAGPVSLMNGNSQRTLIHVATGIYDIRTITNIVGTNGTACKQEVIVRLTNLSADRMMVQMTVQNFDAQNGLSAAFSTSGYLRK